MHCLTKPSNIRIYVFCFTEKYSELQIHVITIIISILFCISKTITCEEGEIQRQRKRDGRQQEKERDSRCVYPIWRPVAGPS